MDTFWTRAEQTFASDATRSVPLSHPSLTTAPSRMYLIPFLITVRGHVGALRHPAEQETSSGLVEQAAGFRRA